MHSYFGVVANNVFSGLVDFFERNVSISYLELGFHHSFVRKKLQEEKSCTEIVLK